MRTDMKLYLILLVTWRVQESSSQEVTTPSSQLKPRNFNHHSLLNEVEPTKQGPVLFPNDGPPPPRQPLIVTSRPLVESIARSELGENNTATSQSQARVAFLPFLARVKDYRPYNPSPTLDYQFAPTQVPYAELVKETRFNHLQRDNRYDDYEEQTALPPIYKALSDHANQKVLRIQQKKPAYTPYYHNNDVQEENNSEDDQNQNYAFSYTVKDQKTGDDFSHSQHSSGSATNGEYRVRLPDGRMQIVSYTADENGYKADVRYDEDTAGNTIENHNQHNHNQNTQIYNHNRYNDYVPNEQNNYAHNHHRIYQPKYYVTPTRQSYITDKQYITPVQHNNYEQTDYSDRQVDYTDRNNNHKYDYVDTVADKKDTAGKDRDYYQYSDNTDLSKEYYNDYSSEYNSNNEPHKSKFNFVDNKNVEITDKATASTVKPSYEELKHLFVTKAAYNTQNNYDPVEIKVPSTTPIPYDGTTEHVVHIGGRNLYTNIKHSFINATPAPISFSTPKVIVASTPRNYLVSTIANLKNKVNLVTKPVLSDNYISRINKYINFNNN